MKYQLILDDDAVTLENTINDLIEQGWEPLGGVAMQVLHREWENERKGYTEQRTDYYYAQAMIRREQTP